MTRARKWLFGASLLALATWTEVQCQSGNIHRLFSSPAVAAVRQQLSLYRAGSVHAIVDAGRLEILRWPDFSRCRSPVREFYELNGYAPVWIQGDKASPQALALIAILQQADRKGLDPEDYDGPRWADRLARLQQDNSSNQSFRLSFDVALTVSAMRYASDLSIGRVNPDGEGCGIDGEQNSYDLAAILHRAAQAGDLNSVFEELEPPFELYRHTEQALQRYSQLARTYELPALAPLPKTIKPGEVYSEAPSLARLLRTLGDLHQDLSFSDPPVYEGGLVTAVKRFQHRHGLRENGWLTPKTVSELNVPLSRRVQQLQLALERLRWLPRSYSRPPVVVNIPSFQLYALNEHYQSSWMTNVVVGKAYQHRTPIFEAEMRYLIFRPFWYVPNSIARKELLPKIEKDFGYLQEHDYEIVAAVGHAVEEGPVTESMLDQIRSGALRIRQRPGPKNALGLVKFVFPNPYDVYMHSTPARELFSRTRRDFSHGCIRVEHADELAAWCLRDKPGWSLERVRAVMDGTQTVRVDLDSPIPVLIVYGTAIVSADGEAHFYDDIYGYDAELEQTLAKNYPYAQ